MTYTPQKIVSIMLAVIIGLFLVQNLNSVQVQFLFWSVQMPGAILIFVVFIIGVVIGYLWEKVPHVFSESHHDRRDTSHDQDRTL